MFTQGTTTTDKIPEKNIEGKVKKLSKVIQDWVSGKLDTCFSTIYTVGA